MPGPKPGPPGSQRTARLVVRVTPAELSAYQAAAGRAGVSMGEWVRGRLDASMRTLASLPQEGLVFAWDSRHGVLVAPKQTTAAAEKEHGG